MENILESLKKVSLFRDIETAEIKSLLTCLSAKTGYFKAKEAIFLAGDKAEFVGIVLSGQVQIVKEDFYGNKNIVASVETGQLFGEAFACADIKTMPVSVFAVEDCEIMLIDYRRIITTCPHNCSFHSKLIIICSELLRIKILCSVRKSNLFQSVRQRKSSLLICRQRQKKQGANHSLYHITGKSLRIISSLTEALCRRNYVS